MPDADAPDLARLPWQEVRHKGVNALCLRELNRLFEAVEGLALPAIGHQVPFNEAVAAAERQDSRRLRCQPLDLEDDVRPVLRNVGGGGNRVVERLTPFPDFEDRLARLSRRPLRAVVIIDMTEVSSILRHAFPRPPSGLQYRTSPR